MRLINALMAALLLTSSHSLWAQDANLKKNLAERLPSLPKIEEISKTPMPVCLKFVCKGMNFFTPMPKVTF